MFTLTKHKDTIDHAGEDSGSKASFGGVRVVVSVCCVGVFGVFVGGGVGCYHCDANGLHFVVDYFQVRVRESGGAVFRAGHFGVVLGVKRAGWGG